ncbi:hypothetical protein J132_10058 [Termitomyces sp. J132]|nr:hypothetical protein H2248_008530 [Termitomyces sp. 'cryptogamus']KNZ81780.1 hypothetical protein J132_10058 [Termitomyces sp. J132]
MFSTLLTVALFAAPALADFAVNTPNLVQCQSAEISWAPTTGPYNLIVVSAEDPCGDALFDLGDHDGTSIHWTAALPAGANVQISVEDSTGDEAWSGVITVGKSNDSSCVPASVADIAKSESASEAASSSIQASSSAKASSAKASSAKASSTQASSTTAQSPSGTTVVVTPTATVNVAASTAEDPAPSAVGAAASNPLLGNGASSVRQSASVVLGALAAVLAFSL